MMQQASFSLSALVTFCASLQARLLGFSRFPRFRGVEKAGAEMIRESFSVLVLVHNSYGAMPAGHHTLASEAFDE